MSAPLPAIAPPANESFDGLLHDLLGERSQLSAVETFSRWHEGSVSHQPELAKHYSALMPTSSPGPEQQFAFEVDLDACSGCKACVVACHNLNHLESDETWRKVGWLTSHQAQLPVVQHVTTACHHCVDPGCLNGCPVKAYEKDPLTGIVRHLDDQCFGCKYCTMMCPYEVPQYSPKLGIVRKCDMCHQRMANNEAPACVQACPNQAIRIRIVHKAEVRESIALTEAALLPTAPPSSITIPTTKFVASRTLPSSVLSTEAVSDSPHEGHLPLVGMLVFTQASVGLWLAIGLLLCFQPQAMELRWSAVLATLTGIVGVHLALFHLGRPSLAYRAFLGWRASWLSREAIAFGGYMGATSLATFLICVIPPDASRMTIMNGYRSLAMLSASVGLVAVFCSAMIYVATQRKLWCASRTIGGFFATTIALGASFVGLTPSTVDSRILAGIAVVASLFAFLPSLCDVLRYVRMRVSRQAAIQGDRSVGAAHVEKNKSNRKIAWDDFHARSGGVVWRNLFVPWLGCWTCWSVASIASIAIWYMRTTDGHWVLGSISILLLVAHLLHRWLYFSSIVTHRMPGAST